ncbi:MAG: DUF5916 domain-containing protein [Candidatus Zixiibacteriota bacterium]
MTTHSYSKRLQTLLFAVGIGALSFICSVAPLAAEPFVPTYNPLWDVSPTNGQIKVDGNIDDAGWKNVRLISGFVERNPGDQIRPAVNTEAYITYDDDNLYIGFVCYDDPAQVRSTMCQRDQFFDDDEVSVSIDTYSDASRAYMFHVNPYGIQKDGLWTSISTQGVNYGIDFLWNSAAKVTDEGYQVEIAIPFASIRFPDQDVQSWKIDLRRVRPRESQFQYGWAAIDRNEQCWPCQWSTVTGVKHVKPGKGIEILPTYLAYQSGSRPSATADFDNEDVKGEPSIMSKYAISSDITFEGALNPDFSQIEADAARIDVNSNFALYYPERRPFFQEGSDIFQTLFNAFYSRTINDPQYAGKFTVRKNRFSFGYVSALDENTYYIVPLEEQDIKFNIGKSYVNVLRGQQTFGQDSRLGFLVTDRRFDVGGDGYGTTTAVDGDIRLSRNYSIDGQFVYAMTKEPNYGNVPGGSLTFNHDKHDVALNNESYDGFGYIFRFMRNSRTWNFTFNHNAVSPGYRTQLGYDPLNNYRDLMIFANYVSYFDKSDILERSAIWVNAYNRWNFDGLKKNQNVNIGLNNNLRYMQTQINAEYGRGMERYDGIDYDDIWDATISLYTRPSDAYGHYIQFAFGRTIAYAYNIRGNEIAIETNATFKPIDRITIEPNFRLSTSHTDLQYYDAGSGMASSDNRELYRQMIVRVRLQLQVSKQMSLRLVTQYNNTRSRFRGGDSEFAGDDVFYSGKRLDIDPLITYRLSSFSVFYLGSTSGYRNYDVSSLGDPVPEYEWKLAQRQFFMKLQYLFQT